MTTQVVHREGCMCDPCIVARKRAEVEGREAKKAADAYIARRGGEPKRGELADALRHRKQPT